MIRLYKYWQFYLQKMKFIFAKRPVNRDFLRRSHVNGGGLRQSLSNRFSECIACGNCVISCPVSAIRMETEEFKTNQTVPISSNGYKFQKDLRSFLLDYGKCIQCGDCVNVCPSKSLQFTTKSLPNAKKMEDLQVDLIHLARKNRILGGQLADKFD